MRQNKHSNKTRSVYVQHRTVLPFVDHSILISVLNSPVTLMNVTNILKQNSRMCKFRRTIFTHIKPR